METSESAPHCPVCAAPLRRPVRRCPACRTLHHAECWKYIGGCAIYACVMRAEPPRMQAIAPVEIGREYRPSRTSLMAWLLVFTVVSGLVGMLVPSLALARKRSKITDCKGNLSQLGIYLNTYVSRYGDDCHYPAARLPAGVDCTRASRGSNGAFWSHLWTLPTTRESASRRPGDNGLYKCKVYGGAITDIALDYSGPNLANTDAFPQGRLSDRVLADTYIAGDLLNPGNCNHGDGSRGPNYDFNGLRFDGSVQNIVPSGLTPDPHTEHGKYILTTDALTGEHSE